MGWRLDPTQLVPIAIAAALYARRARTLAQRGSPVPGLRKGSFAAGLLVVAVAIVSPIDSIGEERLFSVHMVQHLLIGDLAPLLVALGLSRQLTRPALAVSWLGWARALTHPIVALPLWAADLLVWHIPSLYDAALGNDLVHAFEHACFFTGGLLLWTTLIGLLPGPRWFGRGSRLLALAIVWVTGGALANVFLWSDSAFYPPYVHAARTWGLSPLADQRAGGGAMLLEMMLVGVVVFVLTGLDWLADAERRQALSEARGGAGA
jgi:cytochrome c oxidase assembly factor CtaG